MKVKERNSVPISRCPRNRFIKKKKTTNEQTKNSLVSGRLLSLRDFLIAIAVGTIEMTILKTPREC